MSGRQHEDRTPPAASPLTLDQHEAARLTGLSAKTLDRRAAAGEPVGRIKTGRRVLYLRSTLEAWLASKLAGVPAGPVVTTTRGDREADHHPASTPARQTADPAIAAPAGRKGVPA